MECILYEQDFDFMSKLTFLSKARKGTRVKYYWRLGNSRYNEMAMKRAESIEALDRSVRGLNPLYAKFEPFLTPLQAYILIRRHGTPRRMLQYLERLAALRNEAIMAYDRTLGDLESMAWIVDGLRELAGNGETGAGDIRRAAETVFESLLRPGASPEKSNKAKAILRAGMGGNNRALSNTEAIFFGGLMDDEKDMCTYVLE